MILNLGSSNIIWKIPSKEHANKLLNRCEKRKEKSGATI
ncbi:hypothetical protein RDI58_010103 [Solanum bulbocastanum]|uniref:Uncharacterized protein n=1 Tax=Solanum bulbocastanum TaxID=147425 RepID=A0AAN8YG16_SOLBU